MTKTTNNVTKKKVSFIVAGMHQYREKFHIQNKDILSEANIDFELLVSPPKTKDKNKGDQVKIPWAKAIKDIRLSIRKHELIFQLIPLSILKSDLIIVIQENSYILNYLLSIGRYIFKYKLAYFGHGKNYQASDKNIFTERWKRFWINKCDWWFTYTDGSAENISSNGFQKDKITVFYNSIDTRGLKENLKVISVSQIDSIKTEFNLHSENIGVFIGGIYEEKRLGFLIESSILIKNKIPDFILFICGDGPDLQAIKEKSKNLSWIIFTGPIFENRKAAILKISMIMLMPGLVGLAVLDAFAAGIPLITTSIDYHSPEIDYLKTSGAGIIVDHPDDINEYAQKVINLLNDKNELNRIKRMAFLSSELYSIENMSNSFCKGLEIAMK
jgi:glycosyltransferase involved in cell wall biosynthesis